MTLRPSILDADKLNGLWAGAFAFTLTGFAMTIRYPEASPVGAAFSLIGAGLLFTAHHVAKKRWLKAKPEA